MLDENQTLHYHARFEARSTDPTGTALDKVVDSVFDWLLGKEGRRSGPLAHLLRQADRRGLAHGLAFPEGYLGKRVEKGGSRLCSQFLDDGGRSAWALEYDEPDSGVRMRRWHTSVGLSMNDATGACLVNVRVSYHMPPSALATMPRVPAASTPRLVRDVLSLPGLRCSVGPTTLRTEPVPLGATSLRERLVPALTDPRRELPLVLVASDESGDYPIEDPSGLARDLMGMANLYLLDCSCGETRRALAEAFPHDTPAFAYRCGRGMLRLYGPGVDLCDPDGWHDHVFFPRQRIRGLGEKDPGLLVRTLSGCLSRSVRTTSDDVLGVDDVALRRRAITARELAQELQRLKRQVAQQRAGSQADVRALSEELEALRAQAREWQQLAEAYDADARAARGNAQRLQDQVVALSNRASSLEYHLGAANARVDSLARENATLRHAAQSLEGLEHLPNDLDSVLCLAEQLWPDRIVVLDEAHRSARAFAGTNLDEQWQVVSSVATKLWPLYFEGDCGDVAAAYKQASGYDLALTEGKLTKADARMMRLRQRTYHGETIDVTPHIKGRDSSPAMALRLHYHVDRKRQLIVIGHCGAHLTTYGTQRLS